MGEILGEKRGTDITAEILWQSNSGRNKAVLIKPEFSLNHSDRELFLFLQ